jgi:hypothetical protein
MKDLQRRVGKKYKNFSLFAYFVLSKMGELKYLSGGQNKIKIYSGIKFCSEMGLNTLFFSCFACFGAKFIFFFMKFVLGRKKSYLV